MSEQKQNTGEKCSYHLCENKGKLFKCKYCGNYYCKRHIKPKMVLTLDQVTTAKEPIRSWLEKEWRREDGHPDFIYTQLAWQKLKAKEKNAREKMWEALDRLKETPKVPPAPVSSELPNTIKKMFKPPQLKKDEEPSTPLVSEANERKIPLLIRRIWYEIGISFYSFVKYMMIVLILLTLLNVLLIGKFGLLPLLLRSFGIVLLGYLIFFFYRKTRHIIPGLATISDVVEKMLSKVPIAELGDYTRLTQHMTSLAEKLLSRRMFRDEHELARSVAERLCTGYKSHSAAISMTDAKELGLRLSEVSRDVQDIVWNIHKLWVNTIIEYENSIPEETLVEALNLNVGKGIVFCSKPKEGKEDQA